MEGGNKREKETKRKTELSEHGAFQWRYRHIHSKKHNSEEVLLINHRHRVIDQETTTENINLDI